MWLRSGDTSSANNFLSFLEDTLYKLKNKTVGLIRLDSGLFQANTLDYLELKSIDYIIAAKFTHPIQRVIHDSVSWIVLDTGNEICEKMYKSNSWEKERRMVIVRQRIKKQAKYSRKLCRFLELLFYKKRHRKHCQP